MPDQFTGSPEMADINPTPQEINLYQHHLDNLNNNKGVLNPDGSLSTIKQAVIGDDKGYYNIPTIWDGKELPIDQAVNKAAEAGWDNWPKYKSPEEADKRYMNQMHPIMQQETKQYLQNPAKKMGSTSYDKSYDDPEFPEYDNVEVLKNKLDRLEKYNKSEQGVKIPSLVQQMDNMAEALKGTTNEFYPAEPGKNYTGQQDTWSDMYQGVPKSLGQRFDFVEGRQKEIGNKLKELRQEAEEAEQFEKTKEWNRFMKMPLVEKQKYIEQFNKTHSNE